MAGLILTAGVFVLSRLVHIWLPLDILRHFTIHFIIVALAFGIGFIIPGARLLTTTLLLLAGFVFLGAYAHHLGANNSTVISLRPGERVLRVMTFNTRVGNKNYKAIIAEIRRLSPDLALLVEFGPDKRIIYDLLKAEFPYVADCGANCQFGLLSRIPISLVELKNDWDGPWLIRAILGGDFSDTNVIGVHLTRPPNVATQFRQIRRLGEYLNPINGKILVMGDFNATPFSELFNDLAKNTNLERLTAVPSWPSYLELPQLAIDHVLASPGFRVLKGPQIGHSVGSDHYPLSLTVAVPIN
jgi:endonuclease/exonuclease/phosphatase (EEP) superfamily protein YafD